MAQSSPPSLAAALIMRDEARCIARCLDSVRPWVDRMIVVDTGSTDESVAIARDCGAQVHHLDWADDFSAARNRSLDLADADWTLVIDADEWIARGGEALRAWTREPPRIGAVCQRNSFDLGGGEGLSRNWIPRLLPRGTRYRGRIHEQPVAPWAVARIALDLGHDGYRGAQAARKADRNTPLLLRDLQERPGDAYTLYQLGKDAEARQAYADASDWYARALPLTPRDANWMHALIVRHLHCLGQTGRAAEALNIAVADMARWAESPDFFFVVGNLALDRAAEDPAHAFSDWLPLAVTAWERCLEIGERPDLEGGVEGRGSYLARHNLDVVLGQLAAA